jgi:peptidoglycan hydrolase-like protein with peptidoglycan-binding domain
MKKLILTTASVLALGIATAGVGNAQSSSAPSSTLPPSSTQSPSPSTMSQTSAKHTQSEIRQAQEQLKSAGVFKGKVDGEMGAETKQAISQFQQQKGLDPTGDLDAQTLAALNSHQGAAGSSMSGSGMSGAGGRPAGAGAGNLNPATPPSTAR